MLDSDGQIESSLKIGCIAAAIILPVVGVFVATNREISEHFSLHIVLCFVFLTLLSVVVLAYDPFIDRLDELANSQSNIKSLAIRAPCYGLALFGIYFLHIFLDATGGISSSPFVWLLEYFAAIGLYISVFTGKAEDGKWRHLKRYRFAIVVLISCFVVINVLHYATGRDASFAYSENWRPFFACYAISASCIMLVVSENCRPKIIPEAKGK